MDSNDMPIQLAEPMAALAGFHLSISSHVVVQLGAELVTDVEQALLELAKNAYDADSDLCEIIIEPEWQIAPTDPVYDLLFPARTNEKERIAEAVGRLQIRDYGDGIPEAAVERGWHALVHRSNGPTVILARKKPKNIAPRLAIRDWGDSRQ